MQLKTLNVIRNEPSLRRLSSSSEVLYWEFVAQTKEGIPYNIQKKKKNLNNFHTTKAKIFSSTLLVVEFIHQENHTPL